MVGAPLFDVLHEKHCFVEKRARDTIYLNGLLLKIYYFFVLFFVVVVALHYIPFPWRIKKTNLLFASYFFYAAWNPPFVILLWISTCVDWFAAGQMHKQSKLRNRRLLLILSLIVNLGMLSWFKYGMLFMQTYADIVAQFGYNWTIPDFNIILPVGISFYTFQTLSYSIDVYRGKLTAEKNILNFAFLYGCAVSK